MTLIFAHRGFSAAFPENTMQAFIEAENAGAEGLELDVQMTKDGELVVIHDEKVDRTTDGTGYVKDYTSNEIRKLNAGVQNSGKKEWIPLLKEVLEWMGGNSIICNIELKNGLVPYEGMEEKVISLVRDFRLQDRIILSSFNHYSIVHAVMLAPEFETAPILAEGLYMPWVYARSIRAKGFHPNYRTASDQIIKTAIDNQIEVRPYTVNKQEEIERLVKADCSAIITDNPKKAVNIRNKLI